MPLCGIYLGPPPGGDMLCIEDWWPLAAKLGLGAHATFQAALLGEDTPLLYSVYINPDLDLWQVFVLSLGLEIVLGPPQGGMGSAHSPLLKTTLKVPPYWAAPVLYAKHIRLGGPLQGGYKEYGWPLAALLQPFLKGVAPWSWPPPWGAAQGLVFYAEHRRPTPQGGICSA
jgi:hypothetical protein